MVCFDHERPLRVVALFSGGASGVRYLEAHDPDYGEAYEIVGGFSDNPDCPGVSHLRERGIPVETNDIRAFYAERDADTADLDVRAEFDAETARLIADFDADLLLLSGYMWIITAALVDAYPTLNVHPADLSIRDAHGDPVYVGTDPVADAIEAGEDATRSTVHFVTTAVDEGPILVRSRPFPVHRDLVEDLEAHDASGGLRDYADAHQEWMKWEGDGPAIATALSLVAAGRVERSGSTVFVDGEPGHYDLGQADG